MAEHVKTSMEVLDPDCLFGECEHDGVECPSRVVEVCPGCTTAYEGEEDFEVFTPWDVAEARDHAPEAGGSES